MRGAVVAVLVSGFTGCADPGEYFTPLVDTFEPATNQRQVNGPGYSMLFAQRGTKLPVSFLLPKDNGPPAEMLHSDAVCALEQLAGFGVYPAALVAGNTPEADVDEGTLDFVERGPGVISLVATFEVGYECPVGTPQAVRGSSTFTFFPSGRVNRHDDVNPATTMIPNPSGCGICSATSNSFFFTSYWALDTEYLVAPTGTPITAPGPAPETCAAFGEDLLAVQWRGMPGSTRTALVDGATQYRKASVFDFQTSQSLTPGLDTISSAVQIAFDTPETQCASALELLAFPLITVDGAEIPLNAHGIYVDDRVHTGGEFELIAARASIPPFAIVLDLGTSEHVRVSRSRGSYTVQPAANGGTLFWFSDGLSINENITITPY